jgi:hypothetical protein
LRRVSVALFANDAKVELAEKVEGYPDRGFGGT